MNEDDYIDSVQLSKRLGVSIHTIRHWRIRGIGPTFNKFGSRVKYHPKEIEIYEKLTQRAHTSDKGGKLMQIA